MEWFFGGVIALPAMALLGSGLISSNWANRHVRILNALVTHITLWALLAAVIAAILLSTTGPLDLSLPYPTFLPLTVGIYFDSLTAVMLLLVSFIGHIIVRYSRRYLDGDSTQGRFLRWVSFTLGSVSMLIISANLVMFTAAWMMTSYGLHQLLTHYPDRPEAVLAARKKFLISRLGDALLVIALVFTYNKFGSFNYGEIFAEAQGMQLESGGGWMLSVIGALYVLGAITKSAQVPFHSWLPDTMETPTPVSALMHAGIINAGGFLVIRLSPLIAHSHLALDVLAIVGALTALFGSVVMLTQTSIKRSLAYSTIAQMGMMMLQCGLGAFSAAMLHIVAHSLYKAHAFLSSGSAVEASSRKQSQTPQQSTGRLVLGLLSALAIAGVVVSCLMFVLGLLSDHEPGGMILSMIFTLSLAQLLWNSFLFAQPRLVIIGLANATLVSVGYIVAWFAMDSVLSHSVPHIVIPLSWMDQVVVLLVAGGFLAVFSLQIALIRFHDRPMIRALYVKAANGFYFDIAAHKLVSRVWSVAPIANKNALPQGR